ncbi:MAG TPA: long-chain fatty acid--CoA ligase [Blastocatellia bacterium]|jgi:long-chain acyl-CoA synthetase|nr:long-chain fatty acid--CoA ligase [Blastocatellia bacterium]
MATKAESTQAESPYAGKPWLKHYDFWVPATATYPRQPLFRALEIGAANYPDRAATIFFGAEISFRSLQDRALRLANALVEFGITRGDRVGIMLPNCPQFPIAFFAVLRAGATVVSINPTYTPREFQRLAVDSGIRILIAMDQMAAGVVGALGGTNIEHVIITALEHYMPEQVATHYVSERGADSPNLAAVKQAAGAGSVLNAHGTGATAHRLSSLIESSAPRHFRVDIDPERDIAALQYTGGTTGTPKGAMLTHFNLFANTIQSILWRSYFSTPEGERLLMVIPLFHVYGMTVGMAVGAIQGSTMILIPKFDVNLLIDAIERYRPTFFPAVPTLYVSMLNHPRAAGIDFSSIKYFNSGSAPLPLDVIEKFEALTGCVLRQGYGLSETSPTTHTTSQLGLRKPESCGLPFPDTECKIVDLETGETEMAAGKRGELCIRGPQVMLGYWNQPEETARALRPDPNGGGPWFYTGDIARMDEDGYFYIVQRKKDMIIVSGFNVYPSEVEEVLYSHPAVMEAGVIGINDEYRGERVKAFVALRPGMEASEEELVAHCRLGLAKFKVPSEIRILPGLPKTAVGKILHRELRELETRRES